MAMLKGADAFIILAIVILLFGSTLIPRLARSIGEAARELKSIKHDRDNAGDDVSSDLK